MLDGVHRDDREGIIHITEPHAGSDRGGGHQGDVLDLLSVELARNTRDRSSHGKAAALHINFAIGGDEDDVCA